MNIVDGKLKYFIAALIACIVVVSGALLYFKSLTDINNALNTATNSVTPITEVKAENVKAESESCEKVNVLTVRGTGIAYAKPDIIKILFSVTTPTPVKDPLEAYNDVVERAKKAIEAIKSITGVKNVTTLQLTLTPEYRWYEGKRYFEGYIATYRFQVITSNATVAGEVIRVAVENGVNTIDSLVLTFSNELKGKLYMEALEKAVENAKRKAELVAGKLGVKIVGVKSISIEAYYITPPIYKTYYVALKASYEGGRAYAPPIELGEVEAATATVNVVFEISSE